MKNHFLIFLLVYLSPFFFAQAQESVTDTIILVKQYEVSGGKLIFEGDTRIGEELHSLENIICKTGTSIALNTNVNKVKPVGKPVDLCTNQPKILGFKIQILHTKNRSDAEKAKAEFSKKYPDISVEMAYKSPDYRILAGDYISKESASADYKRVKREYQGALLVEWRVWCRKAK